MVLQLLLILANRAQNFFNKKYMDTVKKVALALALLSYFVVALDGSIVFTGLEKISADLSLSQTSLSWVQNAYVLAFGGFMLMGGKVGDVLGRKTAINWSLAVFAIGSLLAGISQSAAIMIFARFVQGVAAAVLAPSALALIMDYFQGQERTKAVAWYSSISGLGLCFGLIFGGFITSLYSWRIGFLANIPLASAMGYLSQKYLAAGKTQRHRFDFLGTIISVCGVFAFVYAINGAEHFLCYLALSAALLAIFLAVEKQAKSPIMPLEIFYSPTRNRAYFGRFLFVGALMGLNFFVSEYMQIVLHFSPFKTGLGFFPLTICTFLAAIKVPSLVKKFGNYKTLFAGIALMAFGFALLWQNKNCQSFLPLALAMLFIGFGQGFGMSPLTNLGIEGIAKRNFGAASGIVNAAHQIGGAVGLSTMVSFTANTQNAANAFGTAMLVGLIFTLSILAVIFCKKR